MSVHDIDDHRRGIDYALELVIAQKERGRLTRDAIGAAVDEIAQLVPSLAAYAGRDAGVLARLQVALEVAGKSNDALRVALNGGVVRPLRDAAGDPDDVAGVAGTCAAGPDPVSHLHSGHENSLAGYGADPTAPMASADAATSADGDTVRDATDTSSPPPAGRAG